MVIVALTCLRRYDAALARLRMGESTGIPLQYKVLHLEEKLEQKMVLQIEGLGLMLYKIAVDEIKIMCQHFRNTASVATPR